MALFCAMVFMNGLYVGLYRERPFSPIALGHIGRNFVMFFIVTMLFEVLVGHHWPAPALMITLFVMLLATVAIRFLVQHWLWDLGFWRTRILVVGTQSQVRSLDSAATRPAWKDYDLAGVLTSEDLELRDVDWHQAIEGCGAQRILVLVNGHDERTRDILNTIMRSRVPFMVVHPLDDLPVVAAERAPQILDGSILVNYRSQITEPRARLAKAVFDIAVSLTLILMAAPVMLLIAAAVKMDGGPVFFAHERIGANGRRFRCYKFRSMVRHPQQVLQQVLRDDPIARLEWAERQKLTHDPRVTRVGRFLRAASLDELPQLFNVVRLDMSLVGPRPIVENEMARYGDDIEFYFKTRPGLTGLWQVSGRSDTTYARRVELDRHYVKNWRLVEDITIMLRTLPAVIGQKGAR